MQFLSPAQLVLVLWLLAAAAPAATVLMNGSMLPLTFYGTEETAQPAPTAGKSEASPVKSAQRVAVLAEVWTRSVGTDLQAESVSGKLPQGQIAHPASVSSVLHTGVQRHRPKAA
jgi:hypothetical protein